MTIYVELLDEGTSCWRPVEASDLSNGRFQITGLQPDEENWQFKTGDIVACELKHFQNGSGLVAYKKVGI
jgi:hypothetical protein